MKYSYLVSEKGYTHMITTVTSYNYDSQHFYGFFDSWEEATEYAKCASLISLVSNLFRFNNRKERGDFILYDDYLDLFWPEDTFKVSEHNENSHIPVDDLGHYCTPELQSSQSITIRYGLETDSDLYVSLYDSDGHPYELIEKRKKS